MKRLFIYAIILLLTCACKPNSDKTPKESTTPVLPSSNLPKLKPEIQNGDLIFQTSLSNQSMAIQIATDSKYSHMGMIYREGEELLVYEAVQPVKFTPLAKWIARGKDQHYVVKRLKNSEEKLTPASISKMKSIGRKYLGKNYDLKFEWSDDKIYCSELVWKIYKEAFDVEIGVLEQVKDFDLSDPKVQQKVKERYGNNLPMDEFVITPDRMFNSDKLITILEE